MSEPGAHAGLWYIDELIEAASDVVRHYGDRRWTLTEEGVPVPYRARMVAALIVADFLDREGRNVTSDTTAQLSSTWHKFDILAPTEAQKSELALLAGKPDPVLRGLNPGSLMILSMESEPIPPAPFFLLDEYGSPIVSPFGDPGP